MIKIKNALFAILSLLVLVILFLNFDTVWDKISSIANPEKVITIKEANQYKKNDDFYFVKQLKSYVPQNPNDLKNIFYSVLNQGWTEFTFYCPIEYSECLKDVIKLSNDQSLLSDINNYVHPYNSYSSIKILYDEAGEILIKIYHKYSDEEINKIDKDIDIMINNITNEQMTITEKIRALHDHIINETKYDTKKANNLESNYDSERINGVLYDHYAICSGYTDIMAVILSKLNVPNFKVASLTHVWNAVYLDGKWLHLDLTWDDPVSPTGNDILEHNYFLIDTNTLEITDTNNNEHTFDKNIYYELNN